MKQLSTVLVDKGHVGWACVPFPLYSRPTWLQLHPHPPAHHYVGKTIGRGEGVRYDPPNKFLSSSLYVP